MADVAHSLFRVSFLPSTMAKRPAAKKKAAKRPNPPSTTNKAATSKNKAPKSTNLTQAQPLEPLVPGVRVTRARSRSVDLSAATPNQLETVNDACFDSKVASTRYYNDGLAINALADAAAFASESEAASDVATDATTNEGVPVKRPRGRPKGSGNKQVSEPKTGPSKGLEPLALLPITEEEEEDNSGTYFV
jgi:hypothetical protein